jgi:antitoxin YefM
MSERMELDRGDHGMYSNAVQLIRSAPVAIRTTYTDARQRLAELWRCVEEDREAVIITRRGHEEVALISADELKSLQETAHLLRSPANARRLLRALDRALSGGGTRRSVSEIQRELGLGQEEEE